MTHAGWAFCDYHVSSQWVSCELKFFTGKQCSDGNNKTAGILQCVVKYKIANRFQCGRKRIETKNKKTALLCIAVTMEKTKSKCMRRWRQNISLSDMYFRISSWCFAFFTTCFLSTTYLRDPSPPSFIKDVLICAESFFHPSVHNDCNYLFLQPQDCSLHSETTISQFNTATRISANAVVLK